jgi:hypothetical protein
VFLPAAVYRPRNPQMSDYRRCVEDYFVTFIGTYDEHFSRQYGFWRPYIEQVIYRYLVCGDLRNGLPHKNADYKVQSEGVGKMGRALNTV